ncbi:hypothetical protein Hanom_Chr10g00957081 [Helianthus anomalus]
MSPTYQTTRVQPTPSFFILPDLSELDTTTISPLDTLTSPLCNLRRERRNRSSHRSFYVGHSNSVSITPLDTTLSPSLFR